MIIKYDRFEFMASGKTWGQFFEDKYGKCKVTVLDGDHNQDSLTLLIEKEDES